MLPVLVALAPVAILLFVIIAGQPGEFVVTRSGKMAAPPEKVFVHVNELRKWDDWSPWAGLILMRRTPLPARTRASARR